MSLNVKDQWVRNGDGLGATTPGQYSIHFSSVDSYLKHAEGKKEGIDYRASRKPTERKWHGGLDYATALERARYGDKAMTKKILKNRAKIDDLHINWFDEKPAVEYARAGSRPDVPIARIARLRFSVR